LTRHSFLAAAALLALATLLVPAGCAHRVKPATTDSNLIFRNADGTEVARAWMQLPPRLPGPGRSFGGPFRLISARGDFPTLASDRYVAFVSEAGESITANLNPSVADHNVTLAARVGGDEDVKGTWALSTFGGVKPRGTFVLVWPRK
jgi:hypothetical protein